MSRDNQIVGMVREKFPVRAFVLDGWNYPDNSGKYANPVKIFDTSLQDIGGESSDDAIFAIYDISKPSVRFSEKGIAPMRVLPKCQSVINFRKIHGIEDSKCA